jgi:TRAP transporter 4TM/12TM fusion protein
VSESLLLDTKFRSLQGVPRATLRCLILALTLLGALWALEVQNYLPWALFREQYLGLFLALALGSIFLGVRARKNEPEGSIPWYDWLFAVAGFVIGGYLTVLYPTIAYRLGILSPDRWILGGLAIFLLLEATRRLVGWALVSLAAVLIVYAKYAYIFPGLLYARGSSWERIASYLYLDTSGLFGFPLAVVASIVVAFIFFGQALYAVGGDKFLSDLALVAMGRYRGGPAKVAVVSSSLFGTVSGSAVSNVVVDGAITIPMMKRAGYPSHLAAAIEAVASTGGQIMPPVMGVAAFLIAEYLNIPYREVAFAAIFPACLYYIALFSQVDLEAAKYGLSGLPADQIPKLLGVLRRGWVFLIPLLVLIYTLMIDNWQPGKAGMAAVISTFICGALQKETRPTLRGFFNSIEETGKTLLDIVAISGLAGLVIGSLQLSGLSFKLSLILVTVAGGYSLLLLSLTALVCILLGMGMPTAIVYIMLAVLVGPALVQIGIVPLAAHLFIFYFGMLSMITPPVCLATYAAASLARSNFWTTGWAGARLGIVAYIVPFVFVYHPALILKGTAGDIVLAVGTATVGVFFLSVGCAGYLFRSLRLGKRALISLCGLLLIPPPLSGIWLVANTLGFAVGLLMILWERNGAAFQRTAVTQPDRVGPNSA